MKLYDAGRAPNPRRVHIFLAEKGIEVPREQIDIMKKEHLTDAFAAINPVQRVPALVLDDGTPIVESIAICRYFEELQPDPPLFGTGALERAQVEMWQRIVELYLLNRVASVFRHLHPAMAELETPQVPAWGEANRAKLTETFAMLERQLAGKPFICGDTFTVADITGLVAMDFMKPAKLAIPPEFTNIRGWHERLAARPSARH